MMDADLKEIEEKLCDAARDPFRFTELVNSWNAVFDAENLVDLKLSDFDAVVDETFQAIATEGLGDVVSARMRQMINALPHAAIAVRKDGVIAAMNEAAFERIPCDPGDQVNLIGYVLERDEDLSKLVVQALDRRNSTGDVIIKRAIREDSDRSATLAIVPSIDDGLARALVFIIDPVWREEIRALLSRAYSLTTAELEILMAFLEGQSLQDIATHRHRSHTTVRTQFQAILNKTGVSSQTELMRNTIAISQFFTDISSVAEVAKHPNRRRFDMLRPDGRLVDVTLIGATSGQLIVSIPDATQFLFPARVEEALQSAGLCMAIICRPGTGQTDPARKKQDYLECLAEDVTALLDQMRRDKAVIMANNMSSVFAYGLGTLIPQRLQRIIVTSTLVPRPWLDGNNTKSPWARALMRAVKQSSSMYKVMIHSAIRAWKVIGSRRMLMIQLKGFDRDIEEVKKRETVDAYDQAMRSTLAQSTEHAIVSFEYASKDWSSWISECQVPIELVQGVHDPSSGFASVEAFAARHPDQITLHRIEDAGYLTFLTHTEEMVRRLRNSA